MRGRSVKSEYEMAIKSSWHFSSMSFNNSNNQTTQRNKNKSSTHCVAKMWK